MIRERSLIARMSKHRCWYLRFFEIQVPTDIPTFTRATAAPSETAGDATRSWMV